MLWVGEYTGGEKTSTDFSPKDVRYQREPRSFLVLSWGRRGPVFCYKTVVCTATRGLLGKEDPTQNVLKTAMNRPLREVV